MRSETHVVEPELYELQYNVHIFGSYLLIIAENLIFLRLLFLFAHIEFSKKFIRKYMQFVSADSSEATMTGLKEQCDWE